MKYENKGQRVAGVTFPKGNAIRYGEGLRRGRTLLPSILDKADQSEF